MAIDVMESYKLSYHAATSTGSRKQNQDVFFADGFLSSSEITEDQHHEDEADSDGQLHVFAVCDGIGMFADSGQAAQYALAAIQERQRSFNAQTEDRSIDAIRIWAEEALIAGRDAMLEHCNQNRINGSCTIVLLAVLNNQYVMVNTGDSPAFLVEDDEITELSVRHNLATLKRVFGAVPVKAEERVLLHHLGEEELIFEEKYGILESGGMFLICSDGVSNAFDEKEMLKKLQEEKKASFFVSHACQIPQADNCTSIIINVKKTAD